MYLFSENTIFKPTYLACGDLFTLLLLNKPATIYAD